MNRAWTLSCVATVHMLSTAKASLCQMAYTLGRSESEVDRALWALTGRTIPDALTVLNRPVLLRAVG